MKSHFGTVIFDFDYTLADSSKGVIVSVNFALDQLGLPTASDEAICRTIGLSLQDTLLKLTGTQYSTLSDEFANLFIQRADQVMADLTTLFEFVPETIELLKQRGFGLGIGATKFRYRIEAILRRENLLDAFDIIVGGEDVSTHKPSPKGLLTAIERMNSLPSSCLYVGDSVTDAETAKRAGMPFVAVLSGVTPEEDFGDYEVYGILADLTQLTNLIENSP